MQGVAGLQTAEVAAAPGPREHPILHRAADRAAVAAMMREQLLTPLLAEPVQSLSAQLQQRFALAVAQLLCADQGVEPVAVAGDAVAVEHAAPPSVSQHPPGDVLRWAGLAVAPQNRGLAVP